MPDDLKQRIREIEESARKVDKLAMTLAVKTGERKLAKEDWEAAVERHMELCRHWEDSGEVADRPLIRAVEEGADDATTGLAYGDAEDFLELTVEERAAVDSHLKAVEAKADPADDWGDESFIDPDELRGTDLVTSRPGAPSHEEPEKKAKRRRKAKA
jgi:hypothetical protein